jgi:hypothetical protein
MDRGEPFPSETNDSFFDSNDVVDTAPMLATAAVPTATVPTATVSNVDPTPVSSVASVAVPTTVASATAAATAAITDLSSKVMESPGLMVASIFVLLLIIFVIIYLYVKLKRNLKFYEVLSKPVYLKSLNKMTLASDSSFPKGQGNQFTYAFWMYYNNITSTTNYKVLMRREDNPIIYLDPTEAKMYIRLRTELAKTQEAGLPSTDIGLNRDTRINWKDTNGSLVPGTDNSTKYPEVETYFKDDLCHYPLMTVSYVPMQRWVHYAIVVDGEYIIVYQDGEINSVLNLANDKQCTKNNNRIPSNNTAGYATDLDAIQTVGGITKTTGDLNIGNIATLDSPDAVISRVLFFNYATTMQNIMELYNKGPMPQSVLSQLGIPMYGMRSPFYRIDSVDVSDANATSS